MTEALCAVDDPSDSTVELDICEEWYYWSGYPCDPHYVGRRPALTDGPNFYTDAAFPTLKPDIDVFGVPPRSRKQRGWYQVAIPFLGRPNDAERLGQNLVHSRRAPAMPSDIPPELFDSILWHMAQQMFELRKMWGGEIDKRGLVRCALVCFYWAVKCQPAIFEKLGLDSREHALQLLDFMRDPESLVAYSVQEVMVPVAQAVSNTVPWLHLMSLIIDRAHQELQTYTVSLKGPLAAGQRMRSLHHRLPRSLPGHFSRHIQFLSLADIHFEKLADLMHLVWEMPDLYELNCERVTWGSLPTALPARKPKPNGKSENTRKSMNIKMRLCGPCVVAALFWLSTSLRRRGEAFLSRDDFTRVLSFARALENRASTCVKAHIWDGFYFDLGQNRRVWLCDYSRQTSWSSSPEWCIDALALDNRNPLDPDTTAQSELDRIVVNEIISSFPALEMLIVGLDSRESMLRFEKEVIMSHLPHLSDNGVLRYALWDPTERDQFRDTGTWLRASPYSTHTESSRCEEDELNTVYDQA